MQLGGRVLTQQERGVQAQGHTNWAWHCMYNPSIWEVEESEEAVQGHPQLYNGFKSSLSYV